MSNLFRTIIIVTKQAWNKQKLLSLIIQSVVVVYAHWCKYKCTYTNLHFTLYCYHIHYFYNRYTKLLQTFFCSCCKISRITHHKRSSQHSEPAPNQVSEHCGILRVGDHSVIIGIQSEEHLLGLFGVHAQGHCAHTVYQWESENYLHMVACDLFIYMHTNHKSVMSSHLPKQFHASYEFLFIDRPVIVRIHNSKYLQAVLE